MSSQPSHPEKASSFFINSKPYLKIHFMIDSYFLNVSRGNVLPYSLFLIFWDICL